jgi:hypothetical protein
MHLYIHKIAVVVVTPECSPDKIETQIEEAIGTRENSVTAMTDKENRMRSPSITVPDPPAWPTTNDKRDEAAYFTAYDEWRDRYIPRADSDVVRAKA